MLIHSLLIRNFRILSDISLTLDRGIQLFVGSNAQGKTSLIEAILFLSTSTSHRTHREEELIRWDQNTAFLRAQVQHLGNSETIECGLEKNKKIIKIDDNPLPRVGDLYGLMRTVLFAPEDLYIVSGSPEGRRRFLDMAIAQNDREYIPLLQKYRRTLRQRNQILKNLQGKSSSQAKTELNPWNQPFLDLAVQIIKQRKKATNHLSPLLEHFYAKLADDGPLTLSYRADESDNSEEILNHLKERLERNQTTEIERGTTQTGPHRDDLHIHLQNKNLSQFGSQGQKRTAALALRMAQVRFCLEIVGHRPIMLIDDVVYEMDNTRRTRFWDNIELEGQLIVTATSRDHLGAQLTPTKTFQVENGTIRPY